MNVSVQTFILSFPNIYVLFNMAANIKGKASVSSLSNFDGMRCNKSTGLILLDVIPYPTK